MKSLIRPTLFAAARLGLFLAVVAWIAGQWFRLERTVDLHRPYILQVVLEPQGIVLRYADNRFSHTTRELTGRADNYNFQFTRHKAAWTVMMANLEVGELDSYAAFRHWFLASVFFTFNLLLHFIYRRRSKPEESKSFRKRHE